MKKQLVIIGIFSLMVTVGLSGCNEDSNTLKPEINKFVGHWVDESNSNNIIDFFSNGTCKFINNLVSTWNLTNGTLMVTFPNSTRAVSQPFSYVFSNNDKTLTITNLNWHDIFILKKQ